jgi:hypothetical protein
LALAAAAPAPAPGTDAPASAATAEPDSNNFYVSCSGGETQACIYNYEARCDRYGNLSTWDRWCMLHCTCEEMVCHNRAECCSKKGGEWDEKVGICH